MAPPQLTLQQVRGRRGVALPEHVFDGARSALCVFCAGFHGAYDVVHVLDHGVPRVHLVDADAEKMESMRRIYPAHWTWHVGDAFAAARELDGRGERFDLVFLDHWTTMQDAVLVEHFELFCRLAARHLLFLITRAYAGAHGIALDAAGLSAWLSAVHRRPVRVVDVVRRSNFKGGTYWGVVRTGEAPAATP